MLAQKPVTDSNLTKKMIVIDNPAAFPKYSRRLTLYLLFLLFLPITYYYHLSLSDLPIWLSKFKLLNECILFGLIGGVIYCLRGMYVNHCALKQWCAGWSLWYLLRPLLSTMMGGISYFILMSGLMAAGMNATSKSPDYFFYLVAFFAGLRVDSFLKYFEGQISKHFNSSKDKESNKTKES